MPLSLDEYVTFLDSPDRTWPMPPEPDVPKARPHLVQLPGIRVVLWTVYGTLLNIAEGELRFESSNDLMMNIALDKTIQEFKMWQSMSRKPGQPADYMKELYQRAYQEQKLAPSGSEKYPEILSEKIWDNLIKKLFQKEYKFDAGFYGSLNEYGRKVAYYFHASLQGTGAYADAAQAMQIVADLGISQGLLADAQCFTTSQLKHYLGKQEEAIDLDEIVPLGYRFLSFEERARKPSETLFRAALRGLAKEGIEPDEILHIGSNLQRDIAPAKKFGMKTGLFAGDKHSLLATPDQLKDNQYRPDVLFTELTQVAQVIG